MSANELPCVLILFFRRLANTCSIIVVVFCLSVCPFACLPEDKKKKKPSKKKKKKKTTTTTTKKKKKKKKKKRKEMS